MVNESMRSSLGAIILFACTISGCEQVLGYQDHKVQLCEPGTTAPCYTGPNGTENKGICHGGTKMCNVDGSGYHNCIGEVVPAPENCMTPEDEDCDDKETTIPGEDNCMCAQGMEDKCPCVPGTTLACYTGPAGTKDVGICLGNYRTCNTNGSGYGACLGEVLPSAEQCTTTNVDENCDGEPSCKGTNTWLKAFGNVSGDGGNEYVKGMAVGSDGTVVIVGDFTKSIDFGCTTGRLDNAGDGLRTDIFVTKLNTDGTCMWSKSFGDATNYQNVFDVALDKDNNVLITGSFWGEINFGTDMATKLTSVGLSDIFIAKLNADKGEHLLSKGYGSTFSDAGRGIAVDMAGNIFVTGFYSGVVSFGVGDLPSKLGSTEDIFIIKMKNDLSAAFWSYGKSFLGTQKGVDIALDREGDVFVVGETGVPTAPAVPDSIVFDGECNVSYSNTVGLDIFIAKFSGEGAGGGIPQQYNGKCLWSKISGDISTTMPSDVGTANGVAVDANGYAYMIGDLKRTANFGGVDLTASYPDMLIAKFDNVGHHVWSDNFDTGNSSAFTSRGAAIAIDAANNVVLAGMATGFVNFKNGCTLSLTGGEDAVFNKLSPDGRCLWPGTSGTVVPRYVGGNPTNTTQRGRAVGVDPLGNVYVAGEFSENVVANGMTYTSQGGFDIFVAKFTP